jgi:tRNA threonylcarbamoyladenosine biosynthesis protein TsaE
MKRTYAAHSIEETWRVAAEVAEQLTPGMVLALTGDLGAGKTTFMQGIALALGIKRPITSPTFTLCQEYQTPKFKLVHMDLYRLNGPDDLLTIGFPEHLESGAVVAVEWPERGGDLIPRTALHITLSLSDDAETRTIEITQR